MGPYYLEESSLQSWRANLSGSFFCLFIFFLGSVLRFRVELLVLHVAKCNNLSLYVEKTENFYFSGHDYFFIISMLSPFGGFISRTQFYGGEDQNHVGPICPFLSPRWVRDSCWWKDQIDRFFLTFAAFLSKTKKSTEWLKYYI